jgi:excisionase family DNA binding protein
VITPSSTNPSDSHEPFRLALSAEEVAQALGISRAHVFRLASSGRLPSSFRLGRAVRWDKATLEAWLAAGAPPRARWEAMRLEQDRPLPRTRRDGR